MKTIYILVFLKFITSSETLKPQSVNVALETVLEFDRKSIPADIKFLDDIQKFINQVKTVISTGKPSRRFNSDSSKGIKFVDFVRSAILTLKSYNDDDLEDVFTVFDGEIRKYHYKGCKFYELVEDQNLRRFVAQKLDDVKAENAVKLRESLDKLMQAIDNSKFSSRQTEFFDYLNSLYRQESSDKLKSCLEDLKTYRCKSKRANLKLIEVVRRGIRTIIFDHYSELNPNARRDLKIKLETIWRDMMHPETSGHKVRTVGYTNMDKSSITIEPNTKPMKNKAESSSEISEEVTKTTLRLQNKIRHIPKTISEETPKAVKTKSVLSKIHKRKHKKISTFITLYPENIGFNTLEDEAETTTQQTINIMRKKRKHEKRKQKHAIGRKSKKRPNRLIQPDPLIITELDTVIYVKRASNESVKLENGKTQPKKNSKPKHTMKHHRRYRPKPTKTSIKLNQPLKTPPLYEDGMSIENNVIERRALEKKSDNDTSNSTHILQVLSNLQNKRDDVININKEPPISDVIKKAPITKVIHQKTKNKPLKIRKRTTAKNKTASTVSLATKNHTMSSISQYKQNITTPSNVTRPIKTTIAMTTLVTRDRGRSKVNSTKHADTYINTKSTTPATKANKNTTTSTTIRPENTTKPLTQSKNDTVDKKFLRSPKENEVDIDHDIDRIIKKYNITIEPEAKVESFDLNKVISSMDKRSDVKADKIKSMIENDLKKIMAPDVTGTPTPANIMSNPFNDIDSALGLLVEK